MRCFIPLEPVARAVLGELLLRGAQTSDGLQANSERLLAMPSVEDFEAILMDLAGRAAGRL